MTGFFLVLTQKHIQLGQIDPALQHEISFIWQRGLHQRRVSNAGLKHHFFGGEVYIKRCINNAGVY